MVNISTQERERLAALDHYHILDTADEKQFDDLVRLASQICQTPIALISLVDAKRQWFKAKLGIAAPETPRDISACQHAILHPETLIIADTLKDERFVTNPLVTGDPHMRFYAGAPLTTPAGHRIGTICVLDTKPRDLTDNQIAALEILSNQVVTLLEQRLLLRQKEATELELLDYISGRKRIENAFREASERYQLLFESIDQGFCIIELEFNSDGTPVDYAFLEVNPAFARHTGIENAQGKTSREITPDLEDHWYEIYGKVATTGVPYHFSNTVASINRWFDVYAFSVGPLGSNLVAVIFSDVSERKRNEKMLLEARNMAESANLAKTEFLANMSHEIRTPMNAIIGLSSILSMSSPLTDKQREFISTLKMSADSLLSLINDLLDIAKIEARTVELEEIPFCITQLVQEAISMMSVRANEKGLSFTLASEGIEHRTYIGDPTRVRQVLLNLCSNAIKFTDTGGIHITISAAKGMQAGTEAVRIAVRDSGIGIAADKLDTIFEKFTQADSSINRRFGGTGLGLAITKTIVEIMGGTIALESIAGQGSTFTVTLPLAVAQADTATARDAPAAASPVQIGKDDNQPCILLVEDYAPNVLVATTVLQQFGYRVDVANDGREAVEKVKHGDYTAILMDVQMHGMNGFDATQLIRAHEAQNRLRHVPIIGMTAHALSGDRERCLSAGMDDYISKPFNQAELRQKLESFTLAKAC